MTTLTLRDIDETVVRRLEINAAAHGRTPEEEAVAIIAESLAARQTRSEWMERAREIAAMTPKDVVQTDSVQLLREDRDR